MPLAGAGLTFFFLPKESKQRKGASCGQLRMWGWLSLCAAPRLVSGVFLFIVTALVVNVVFLGVQFAGGSVL
jgi:hypothetical protein